MDAKKSYRGKDGKLHVSERAQKKEVELSKKMGQYIGKIDNGNKYKGA